MKEKTASSPGDRVLPGILSASNGGQLRLRAQPEVIGLCDNDFVQLQRARKRSADLAKQEPGGARQKSLARALRTCTSLFRGLSTRI